MKYIVLSVDTNGLPVDGDCSKLDLVSISAVEVNFNTMEKVKGEFFHIVSGAKIGVTEKYHGFTQNDVDEYGTLPEQVAEEFINYIFSQNEDIDFSKVTFICTAPETFTFPVIHSLFDRLEVNVKLTRSIEVLNATHLLFNCSYLDEAFDIFGVKISVKNSINKINGLISLIINMREVCQ